MSSSFPSSEERTVASSLLLLHTTPPSPSLSSPKFHSHSNDDHVPERSSSKTLRDSSFSSAFNKSSSSSLTNDDASASSEEDIKSQTISFSSAIARYNQMKFKIARKVRSKVMWTCSGDRKANADEAAIVSPASVSGDASSCLSSSSSGISSTRSLRYANRCRGASAKVAGVGSEPAAPSRRAGSSPHLRRRGDAILKLLSQGGSSEVRIRQMLGDSPDTSKALRMLLRVDAVKRSGSGGRQDPYVYSVYIFIIHYSF
ncbi:hypothetical protein RJT34_23959 [Clitoria ternatea]|uniref:HTH three-helical bundle domain-containing protein n=1 Tax=Clitoria ternatea TaxID=43366 RepID=A0AAN9IIV1_CLITE